MTNITKLEAIDMSIRHWERMRRWVARQPPGQTVNTDPMKACIRETWYGEHCALCIYCRDRMAKAILGGIPLSLYSKCQFCPLRHCGSVPGAMSLWGKVAACTTWGAWHDASGPLLKALRTARNKEERAVKAQIATLVT